MKILVTGGTGFIGHYLVKRLVNDGHKVRVLDNDFRGNAKRLKDINVELIEGDIRGYKTVENAVKDMDTIIHCAAVNGTELFYRIPEVVLDVGTRGMINLIDACKEEVREFYLFSSSEVYHHAPIVPTPEDVPLIIPDPYNPRYSYSGSKILSEQWLIYNEKFFDKAIIVRPHNVYGPDMGMEHVIPQLLAKIKKSSTIPIQGTGEESRAFIYIDDFVDAFVKIMQKGEHLETYNIGTEDEITIKNLIKKIGGITNKKIKVVSGQLQPGGTPRRAPDIRKIRKLGFKSKYSLDEGLKKTIEYYL